MTRQGMPPMTRVDIIAQVRHLIDESNHDSNLRIKKENLERKLLEELEEPEWQPERVIHNWHLHTGDQDNHTA